MTEASNIVYDLMKQYLQEYRVLRDENIDLNNLMFHYKYGLALHMPNHWSYVRILKTILEDRADNALIIFPSTAIYRSLYEEIGETNGLSYISWHEIYTGMQMSSKDVRHMQRTKAILSEAQLTFFLDPPPLPELVDQVRGHTNGCLVVLSRGDGNV